MLVGIEALASTRVFIPRTPKLELMREYVLQQFPAQQLKPTAKLAASAEAFIDELLAMSCQSCFADIFSQENFNLATPLPYWGWEGRKYSISRIDKQPLSRDDYHTLADPPIDPMEKSMYRTYDIEVKLQAKAEMAMILLDKFAELENFYLALETAHRNLQANMPTSSATQEIFTAQSQQYYELYQHTQAQIDQVLANLRTLFDEHGRDYPQEVLASAEHLREQLRNLAAAKEAGLADLKEDLQRLRLEDGYIRKEIVAAKNRDRRLGYTEFFYEPGFTDDVFRVRFSPEAQAARAVREWEEAEHSNYHGLDHSDYHGLDNTIHAEQQQQQKQIDRVNEMAAIGIILDIF